MPQSLNQKIARDSSSGVVIRSDVAMGEAMDVEASLGEIKGEDVSSFQSSRDFEIGEHKVQTSEERAKLERNCFTPSVTCLPAKLVTLARMRWSRQLRSK